MRAFWRIAENLYQTGTAIWPVGQVPPHVDVILFCAREMSAMVEPGVERVAFPFIDAPDGLSEERFLELAALCRELSSRRVMTVCEAGENRSGLASALVLVGRGLSPSEALAVVRSHGPTPYTGAAHLLWNDGFVKQLLSLEEES